MDRATSITTIMHANAIVYTTMNFFGLGLPPRLRRTAKPKSIPAEIDAVLSNRDSIPIYLNRMRAGINGGIRKSAINEISSFLMDLTRNITLSNLKYLLLLLLYLVLTTI